MSNLANVKRNSNLLMLKKKNKQLATELRRYITANQLQPATTELINSLIHNLDHCAGFALYGYNPVDNDITLMSYLACGHKLCNVCNWQRQKKIRRKYMCWFTSNEHLYIMRKGNEKKTITRSQVGKYESRGWRQSDIVSYDLMHLMLSVPHTVHGWRGSRFYFREIVCAFNYMRKQNKWLQLVYGGQFGLETTRNNDGYHIHIHSLLFVAKKKGSRNELHRFILKCWNRLTVDESAHRNKFSDEDIKAICKGNSCIDVEFARKLNPAGATIIHLQTIYWLDNKGQKHYVNSFSDDKFIYAVMETISYLFKPSIFAYSEEYYDIEAIVELLPQVYNNRGLYSKFGCLFGETSLNVKDDSLLEDFEETASSDLVDDDTGEVIHRQYFITNPFNLYSDDSRIRVKRGATGIIDLGCSTAGAAVQQLYSVYQKRTHFN